jgi:hypothetical protein
MDMCYDVSMPTIVHFEYPQMMLKVERNSIEISLDGK